jgi:hypothetical protein
MQAQVVQGHRGQAGGVAVHAEHDDPVVVAGDPGQPGLTLGIQAPLQVVALHDDRAGDLAHARALRRGPDVDEHRALGLFPEGLLGRQPAQPPAGVREDLVNAAGARRAGRHHAAGPSVARLTSPPAVSSYRVICGMGGEYACTLTATAAAAALRTSWM